MILWNTARMSLNRYSDIRTSKVPEITLAFWIIKIAAKRLRMINQGKIRYYNATIPEHQDPNGVVRVQREVVIPIVE